MFFKCVSIFCVCTILYCPFSFKDEINLLFNFFWWCCSSNSLKEINAKSIACYKTQLFSLFPPNGFLTSLCISNVTIDFNISLVHETPSTQLWKWLALNAWNKIINLPCIIFIRKNIMIAVQIRKYDETFVFLHFNLISKLLKKVFTELLFCITCYKTNEVDISYFNNYSICGTILHHDTNKFLNFLFHSIPSFIFVCPGNKPLNGP